MNLTSNERELLSQEVQALLEQVREPKQRARYTELQTALQGEIVPESAVGALETLVALGLRTGRVRKLHGPMAESAFLHLYQKMPTGAALAQSTAQVNRALETLQGQTLERIAFAPKGPGVFTLDLETEEYRVHLEIREEGVWLREVGLDL